MKLNENPLNPSRSKSDYPKRMSVRGKKQSKKVPTVGTVPIPGTYTRRESINIAVNVVRERLRNDCIEKQNGRVLVWTGTGTGTGTCENTAVRGGLKCGAGQGCRAGAGAGPYWVIWSRSRLRTKLKKIAL